jgi:hypothetical protein
MVLDRWQSLLTVCPTLLKGTTHKNRKDKRVANRKISIQSYVNLKAAHAARCTYAREASKATEKLERLSASAAFTFADHPYFRRVAATEHPTQQH